MLLIQELQNREYPFKKLPQDLVDAVIGVLTIPENQVYNSEQKISVLDQTIFYSIASLFPEDKDVIELKAFIEAKESKENNDGFNTNLTDTPEPVEYNVQDVIDNAEYQKRHKNNQLLRLSIEKMLNAQKKGNGFDVERGKNEIGNRIDKAKIFLESKPLQLEPSVVYLYEGKLSFEDGRHRLIAAQELGATHAYFEVPKDQVSEFKKIAGETNVYENGGLIAPNGKKSNLTQEQYKLVRTPEFKAWFGDWEKHPEKVSKVVDENGEPLLMFHGTTYGRFNEFHGEDWEYKKDWSYKTTFWFTSDKKGAKYFSTKKTGGRPYVFAVFLNIRKPSESHEMLKSDKGDGVIDYKYDFINDRIKTPLKITNAVVFSSSQIKLADGSNTTFDAGNPDIRYEEGGQMKYSDINTVRDLANLDAEQEGVLSGAVFSALKKGDVLSVAGKRYTVTTQTKPTESSYYSKKDNKEVDYKKSTIRLVDEKGVTISGEFWEYKNGSGIWLGRGQTKKSDRWGNLSRDIEGDIMLDLINENNEFHGLSDSYKKAQAFIDNYNNMNKKLDKGGNLGLHTGTDQIEVFVVTSDREPIGVFKTSKEAKSVKPSTPGHPIAIHPIEVPVKDWNAGAVTDNAKYYLRKFMLNNYFKKGGTVEFQETNINDDLEAFDLNNLDPLETRFYSDFFKSTGSKVQSLQVLINMVEGDYTQLNEELAILAEKQIPSAQWDKWSQEETYAGGGKIIGDKRAQDIVKYLVKEIRAKTPSAEIPNLEKFIKEGPTKEVLLPAYQEFRFYVNNGNNKDSIRCAYDDSVRFYEYVISFIPNKTQREMFKHYGESQIKKMFPNYKSGGVAGKTPIEPDYNRSVQSEVEDFLDTFKVGESLIDERPADLGSYNSGINWVNLSKAMEPLFITFNKEQVDQAANGLISDGYLSPNFTMLGGYLKRMNENREASNMEGGGSIVKHYGRDTEHRLGRPSGSIEKEILEKVSGRINSEDFVGNFGWKTTTGKLGDGYLYKLDDFDANLVKAIKLKPGEHIFRYVNRLSAIGGMMPFIKINLEKGLLYWLKDSEEDEIHFETLGRKALWVGLIENKYESGGNIYRETVFTKEINRGITITVKKYPNGQIVEIENKHNVHFPFKVGQILNRNAEVWASNNGYLMDGKDVGPEEKIFGIRVKDIPEGHEFRMLYPHKFRKREEGGYVESKAEKWFYRLRASERAYFSRKFTLRDNETQEEHFQRMWLASGKSIGVVRKPYEDGGEITDESIPASDAIVGQYYWYKGTINRGGRKWHEYQVTKKTPERIELENTEFRLYHSVTPKTVLYKNRPYKESTNDNMWEEGGTLTEEEWLNQMTPRQKEITLRRDAINAILNEKYPTIDAKKWNEEEADALVEEYKILSDEWWDEEELRRDEEQDEREVEEEMESGGSVHRVVKGAKFKMNWKSGSTGEPGYDIMVVQDANTPSFIRELGGTRTHKRAYLKVVESTDDKRIGIIEGFNPADIRKDISYGIMEKYEEGGMITERDVLGQYWGVNVFPQEITDAFIFKNLSTSNDEKLNTFIEELKREGFTMKKKSYSDFTSVMGVKRKTMESGGEVRDEFETLEPFDNQVKHLLARGGSVDTSNNTKIRKIMADYKAGVLVTPQGKQVKEEKQAMEMALHEQKMHNARVKMIGSVHCDNCSKVTHKTNEKKDDICTCGYSNSLKKFVN